MNLVTMRI